MSPQVEIPHRGVSHQVIRHAFGDEHLAAGGLLLHPCRHVDRITKSGEVNHLAPDIADVGGAGIDSYAHINPGPVVTAVADRFEQVRR